MRAFNFIFGTVILLAGAYVLSCLIAEVPPVAWAVGGVAGLAIAQGLIYIAQGVRNDV